jgi:hypothetical protein
MKPSNRIGVLARRAHGTYVTAPTTHEYVEAIMDYLDEQENKQPLYTIQPMPEFKDSQTTISDNTSSPKETGNGNS